ncbi:MAG: lysozyme inhibitor LprI family protein [Elainellaceae cyanobacterium]
MNLKWYFSGLVVILVGCSTLAFRHADSSAGEGQDRRSIGTESVSSIHRLSAPTNGRVITHNQIGPARLGMTLGELKQQLGDRAEFVVERSFMVDFDAIAVRQDGDTLFYIIQSEHEPMQDDDPIQLLLTTNPAFRTPDGVGPGLLIDQAASVYGQPTLSYNSENEMRESVRFADFSASNVVFRTNGFDIGDTLSDYALAGVYGDPVEGAFYETTDYRPDATIRAVMVDGYRLEQDSQPLGEVSETLYEESQRRQSTAPNAQSDYEKADAQLNQVYQRAIASLDATATEKLVDAQRAWLTFRDASCRYDTHHVVDGDEGAVFLNPCLADLTRDRTEQLEQLNLQSMDRLLHVPETNWENLGNVTVNGYVMDCENPQTTVEMNTCAGLAYEKKDDTLNQVYQDLRTDLDSLAIEKLTDAQLAWIDFRDAHCAFEVSDAEGGTGYSTYLSSCLARLTGDRTEELQNMNP